MYVALVYTIQFDFKNKVACLTNLGLKQISADLLWTCAQSTIHSIERPVDYNSEMIKFYMDMRLQFRNPITGTSLSRHALLMEITYGHAM